jgi:hypothetical protein
MENHKQNNDEFDFQEMLNKYKGSYDLEYDIRLSKIKQNDDLEAEKQQKMNEIHDKLHFQEKSSDQILAEISVYEENLEKVIEKMNLRRLHYQYANYFKDRLSGFIIKYIEYMLSPKITGNEENASIDILHYRIALFNDLREIVIETETDPHTLHLCLTPFRLTYSLNVCWLGPISSGHSLDKLVLTLDLGQENLGHPRQIDHVLLLSVGVNSDLEELLHLLVTEPLPHSLQIAHHFILLNVPIRILV